MPAPASVFRTVVDAVATRLADNQPTDPPASLGITVYRRTRLKPLETDVPPFVIVAPAAEGEQLVFETFGRGVVYAYPVACLLVSPGDEIQPEPWVNPNPDVDPAEIQLVDHMVLREWLRNQLFRLPLDGVSSVFNVEIVPYPVVETTGAGGLTQTVSGCTAVFHSFETRAA